MTQLLEKINPKPKKAVVGLSGGADSVALLHVLTGLGTSCVAVHVEHGIRGEEALRDAAFVTDFCKKLNVPCFVEHVDVPAFAKEHRISLETAARILRYRVLYEYADKYGCKAAVAHNQNDQAETVLMHLLRGSGLNGLGGMKPETARIIRPLLQVSRTEIEAYCQEHQLSYVTDSTNTDTAITRNKLRLEIIPKLEAFNPSAISAICACASLLRDDAACLNSLIAPALNARLTEKDGSPVLDITGFSALPAGLQSRLVRAAIARAKGGEADIEQVHVQAVLSLVGLQSGRSVDLPWSITAKRVYDAIVFHPDVQAPMPAVPFVPGARLTLPDGRLVASDFLSQPGERNGLCEQVDADALGDGITVRTRRSGDRIQPLGMEGSMPLKEFFINRKIPVTERDNLLLLARGSQVLVLPGITVDHSIRLTDTTRRILRITISGRSDSTKNGS